MYAHTMYHVCIYESIDSLAAFVCKRTKQQDVFRFKLALFVSLSLCLFSFTLIDPWLHGF